MSLGTPALDSWEPATYVTPARLQELTAGVYMAKKKSAKMGKTMQLDMQSAVDTLHQLSSLSASDMQSKFGAQYVSDADETASSDEEMDTHATQRAAAAAKGGSRAAAGSRQPSPKPAPAKDQTKRTPRQHSRRGKTSPIEQPATSSPRSAGSAGSVPWASVPQYTDVSSTSAEPAAFVLGWGAEASSAASPSPLHPCITFPPEEASGPAQVEWNATKGGAPKLLVWWCADGSFSVIKQAAWRNWTDENVALYSQGVSVTVRGTERKPDPALAGEVHTALEHTLDAGWPDLDRTAFMKKLFAATHPDGAASVASAGSSSSGGARGGAPETAAPPPPVTTGSKKRSRAERAKLRAAAAEAESNSSSDDSVASAKPLAKAPRRASAAVPAVSASGTQGTSLQAGDTSEESDEDVPLSAMAGGHAARHSAFSVPLPATGAPFSKWIDALRQAVGHMQRHAPPSDQHTAGLEAAAEVLEGMPAFPRITLAEARRTAAPAALNSVLQAATASPRILLLAKRVRQAWKVTISKTEAAAKVSLAAASPAPASAEPAAVAVPQAAAGAPSDRTAPTSSVESSAQSGAQAPFAAAAASSSSAGEVKPAKAINEGPPAISTNVAAGMSCTLRIRCTHRLHALLKLVLGTFPEEQGVACPTGTIARRLELRIAATVGTPVGSSTDKQLAQWAYMEQSARVTGLPAVFLHIDDAAVVPPAPVPTSASTSPMASLLSATEWRDARKDARSAYVHGMQVLWSTVAQCSAEPLTMGASRPPAPPAASWAGTARASRMAQLAAHWEDCFPHQLWMLTATPPSAPGFGPLKPSTEDSLAPHVAYLAAWRPPWVANSAGQNTPNKRPQPPAAPSTFLGALRAISSRVPQPAAGASK